VVLIVLAADPLLVVDVGAWLSFGAVLGIIVGAGRVASWIDGTFSATRSPLGRLRQATIALMSATLSVEVILLPVNASVFSRVGVAGLLLNFIAIPAMAVVQIAGLLLLVVGAWWDGAAVGTAWLAHAAVRALVGSAALVEIVPWLSWRVPPTSMVWTVAFYAAGGLALLHVWLRPIWRQSAAGVAAFAAVVLVMAPGVERAAPPGGWLRATMLDVGQGEAIVIQFPSGQSLLVDAGGVPSGYDVGGRVVVPALWALGVRRLDWLAFTHADLDHMDGTLTVADVMRPREVWEGTPVPRDERRQALRDFSSARGVAWRQLQRGDVLELGGVEVRVLHPPPPDWERQRVRNDDSLVIRIRYGDLELLLTGDIGRAVETQLGGERSDRRTLRVLKVAHHGSRTSTSAAFMQDAPPHVALISAGRGNLFGHPAPDVLARLAGAGAVIFRTDRDGAIRLETDGRDVRIETITGGRRSFSLWPSPAVVGPGR
jgi:competence protein ComEC